MTKVLKKNDNYHYYFLERHIYDYFKVKKNFRLYVIGLIPVTFFSYSSVHNNINLTNENSQPQLFSYYYQKKWSL